MSSATEWVQCPYDLVDGRQITQSVVGSAFPADTKYFGHIGIIQESLAESKSVIGLNHIDAQIMNKNPATNISEIASEKIMLAICESVLSNFTPIRIDRIIATHATVDINFQISNSSFFVEISDPIRGTTIDNPIPKVKLWNKSKPITSNLQMITNDRVTKDTATTSLKLFFDA